MHVSEFNLYSLCAILSVIKLIAHLLSCLQLVKVLFANWAVQLTCNNILTALEAHIMLARSFYGFRSHNIADWTLVWIRINDLGRSSNFFHRCFLCNRFRRKNCGCRFLNHFRLCFFKALYDSYLPVLVLHQFCLIAVTISCCEENNMICSDACTHIWGSAKRLLQHIVFNHSFPRVCCSVIKHSIIPIVIASHNDDLKVVQGCYNRLEPRCKSLAWLNKLPALMHGFNRNSFD